MSDWITDYYTDVDAMNLRAFVDRHTDDAVVQFATSHPRWAKEAIGAAIGGFWSTIGGLRHERRNLWLVNDGGTCVFEAILHYTTRARRGRPACVSILDRAPEGRVCSLRVAHRPHSAVRAHRGRGRTSGRGFVSRHDGRPPPPRSTRSPRTACRSLDRQEISDCDAALGRGLDLHDWDLYASTCTIRRGRLLPTSPGVRPQSPRRRRGRGSRRPACSRCRCAPYTNFLIDLDGDMASGVLLPRVATHRKPNKHGPGQYTPVRLVREPVPPHRRRLEDHRAQQHLQWCDGKPDPHRHRRLPPGRRPPTRSRRRP